MISSSLKYTKLLLLMAFNFKPTIEGRSENVYTIRALEDAHNIKTKVDEINTVLHLGGGIQNLEYGHFALMTKKYYSGIHG